MTRAAWLDRYTLAIALATVAYLGAHLLVAWVRRAM